MEWIHLDAGMTREKRNAVFVRVPPASERVGHSDLRRVVGLPAIAVVRAF
jgi:hypothetical protein